MTVTRSLMLAIFLLLAISLAAQPERNATPDARMLRFPDVSATDIAFVYAADIWLVSKQGGLARKLTSAQGMEAQPQFSPDGRTLAFTANYDGNIDIYAINVEGGSPRRLTHHPGGEAVTAWYPDGKSILFRSRMTSPSRRFSRLFKLSIEGGLPEQLPLAYGELASFNADASKIAFQYISREARTWKRYRGGMASDLWLYDFKKNQSENFTNFDGTDAIPMWHGDTIYFLSDRDARSKLNIWAYDTKTKNTTQTTHFQEYDVKWPSLGPDAIVFENGGKLHVLDLETANSTAITVKVPADLPKVRVQLKDVSANIQSFSLSPSGKRALFAARGEIFTVPQEHGSIRNLTNTSAVAERYPAWSPDGKHVAYFSDRSGEYELCIRQGDGKGEERKITSMGAGFRYRPKWSPDSKRIAFEDKTGALFMLTIDEGNPVQVDKDPWGRIRSYSWSSDSRWLAYAKSMDNAQSAIFIYDSAALRTRQVTGDYYNDFAPVFDPDGKYLYFYSNRSFSPVYGDMDATWIYPNSTNLYAATLRNDVASPLAPRSDEEEVEEDDEGNDEEKDEDSEGDKDKEKKEEVKPVAIDFDGFEKRVIKLVDIGNVGALAAVKGKVLYLKAPAAGAGTPGSPSSSIMLYDHEEREAKEVMSGVTSFDVSGDGKKLIYRSGSTYGIVDVEEGKEVGDGEIAASKLQAWINPREEWAQIYREAWRVERDFFYDPNMHGVNWEAIRQRYAKMLPFAVDRGDVNYIIGEMIAELNASHAYVAGGDLEQAEQVEVGLLGCDYELDEAAKAYRFKKIYAGAAWDDEARSPLREPGVEVNEGDYLLAVNGMRLDPTQDPWAAFQGLAGEVVAITINDKPTMDGAREATVRPLSSEFRLRYLAWVESNRKKVEEATKGRVGYIYVPDTGRGGQTELVRQFVAQIHKDALIVDERFNSGGQIPDRFIELLNRPILNYWARRDQRDFRTPFVSNPGPKVMLVNGWSGSGGDLFPHYFRKAGIGPLVGTRTWGGLIGISGNPQPIDGGFVSAPTFGFWNTDGNWEIEGHGVDPDYEVVNTPHELAAGKDPQLERAIEVILEMLRTQPHVQPPKPRYPNRAATDKTP